MISILVLRSEISSLLISKSFVVHVIGSLLLCSLSKPFLSRVFTMEMLHEKSTSLYFGVTKFQIFVDLDTKLLAGMSCIRSVGFLSEIE